MKQFIALTLASLGFAAVGFGAQVEATFQDVDSFSDFRVSGGSEAQAQALFEKELARWNFNRVLEEGQVLSISFEDIDMAGDIQPWRNPANSDIRYVESIYPPRMTFSYVLRDAEGNELASGDARISDLSFDMQIRPFRHRDNFEFELRMLEDWMRTDLRKAVARR